MFIVKNQKSTTGTSGSSSDQWFPTMLQQPTQYCPCCISPWSDTPVSGLGVSIISWWSESDVFDEGDMENMQCWRDSRNVVGNPCIRPWEQWELEPKDALEWVETCNWCHREFWAYSAKARNCFQEFWWPWQKGYHKGIIQCGNSFSTGMAKNLGDGIVLTKNFLTSLVICGPSEIILKEQERLIHRRVVRCD